MGRKCESGRGCALSCGLSRGHDLAYERGSACGRGHGRFRRNGFGDGHGHESVLEKWRGRVCRLTRSI